MKQYYSQIWPFELIWQPWFHRWRLREGVRTLGVGGCAKRLKARAHVLLDCKRDGELTFLSLRLFVIFLICLSVWFHTICQFIFRFSLFRSFSSLSFSSFLSYSLTLSILTFSLSYFYNLNSVSSRPTSAMC